MFSFLSTHREAKKQGFLTGSEPFSASSGIKTTEAPSGTNLTDWHPKDAKRNPGVAESSVPEPSVDPAWYRSILMVVLL